MITLEQYFQSKPHTTEHTTLAYKMLELVNKLIDEAVKGGYFYRVIDPDTGTEISGSKGGAGDGGFRLSTATTGSAGSSHKEAKAVDIYDPQNVLDNWVNDQILKFYELYREHPDATLGWCHLTTRAPGSGNRTFRP